MDKIFDVIFSPRNFFRAKRYKPLDSLIVILVIWLMNMFIIYPSLRAIPFWGGYILFSLVLLGLFFVYCVFSVAIHMIVGGARRSAMMGFPYVLIPHIMSGWFFTLSLNNKWISFLYVIPVAWSIILEFYLVRSSTVHGIVYTLVVRFARDIIFFVGIYVFLRGWII